LRKAGDKSNGGAVANILVANVGGMVVDSGDGVGRRGQGVFAAGRKGATARALDEARGWSRDKLSLASGRVVIVVIS